MKNSKQTQKIYGFLWTSNKEILSFNKWHFNAVQNVVDEPIVRGNIGIDIGSGCGYDTYIMAKNNPLVKIVSIDLSDGVYKTRALSSMLKNVFIIQASVLGAPIKDNIFDFAYSFGVLHHTHDPKKGLLEIVRIIKKNCPAFVYLYEDHSGSTMKYIAVKLTNKLRMITVKLPSKVVYTLSWFFAPFVYVIFTIPSKILMQGKRTENLARSIPFSFGTGLFSLHGDLFDRFSAPIEHRFSRQRVFNLFSECGFCNVNVSRLPDRAGWVVWGYKK